MSKSKGLLIISMGMAIALLLMLGSVFAAPSGTVILDPLTTKKSGLPGAAVTYTLWITNSGGTLSITDIFTLGHAGNQWPVDLSKTEILLSGSASTEVVVSVTIPLTATATRDTVTITVYFQGSLLLPSSRLTTNFFRVYLPVISKPEDVCRPTGEIYGTREITPLTLSAETHPDVNLAVRGYVLTTAELRLVDYNGSTDPGAPQLAGVFSPQRPPIFTSVYRVYDWDWGNHRPGDPIDAPVVTLADLEATPGEIVYMPDRLGGDIGYGYKALVLYASSDHLTLKYTGEDSMVSGYGVHLENVCVDSDLLALYQQLNSAGGRHQLPALRAGQAIGRALSNHIGVAIRDTGAFMDPRSRKDWWHSY